MQNFTASLKNPLIQDQLNSALNRGHGVFRAFKDCLEAHPEAEKLWYAYKERTMRDVIVSWYNALRTEWGLEKLGPEPEETGDLVLEDFKFRNAGAKDRDAILALHRLIGKNKESGLNPKPDFALVAETASGDVVAFLLASRQSGACVVNNLEVKCEFQGLGVGKTLLAKLMEQRGGEKISFDLPVEAEGFAHALLRESFEPVMTRYIYKAKISEENEVN
jgi:ribosomal protein S18 acetylase RimI-like enzyme